MNEFFHGVQGFITSVSGRPVTAIRSSVIGAIITARHGPVNTPVLIFGNRTQANALFGKDINDAATAGMTFDGIFSQIGTVVVAVNVCDPAIHNTTVASETVSFNNSTNRAYVAHPGVNTFTIPNPAVMGAEIRLDEVAEWDIPAGITVTGVKVSKTGAALVGGSDPDEWEVNSGVLTVNGPDYNNKKVWITYTAAIVEGVDYTFHKNDGYILRLNTSSKILRGADLTLGYNYTDPSKVTISDVIGEAGDGVTPPTGIYALRAAPTTPGILVLSLIHI
jgi:hypothetical protein